MNSQVLQFIIDTLSGNRKDPTRGSQGQRLPPQRVLDAPIYVPGVTPLPEQGIEDASGLVGKGGGVAAALAERERQRRLLLEQMGN